MVSRRVYQSPVGNLYLASEHHALTELFFENHRHEVDGAKSGEYAHPETSGECPLLESAVSQLDQYFSGKLHKFEIPLAPKGTEFQVAVWNELKRIPHGEKISYIELARRLGDEKKTRAVGLANGKNPISIVIPCHRVIGANGHLTGYGGGIETKRWLLDFEANDQLF